MTAQSIPSAAPRWFALINDRIITAPRQKVPISVLRALAVMAADQVLVRDHASVADPVMDDNSTIDLADGNVFYTSARSDSKSAADCAGPAKLALAVDDRFELSTVAELALAPFLALFAIPEDRQLFRDFESPNDQPITAGASIRFKDGPVFYTRVSGHPDARVEITIDGVKHNVPAGQIAVSELKKIGKVPVADELIQLIAGQLTPLADNTTVCIVGGEEFVSHPRCGGSS
jgi:hypothetical protein